MYKSNLKSSLLTISMFLLIVFSLFFPTIVLATENDSTAAAKLKSGGSYELFWPLTAGKTSDESLYFLKIWKEDLQGMLIFSTAKKADYDVMLATKRILEAEKLLKEGKNDLAIQSLEKASSKLLSGDTQFSTSAKNSNDFQLVKVNISNQLSNLEKFLPTLVSEEQGNVQTETTKTLEIVKKFLSDLK